MKKTTPSSYKRVSYIYLSLLFIAFLSPRNLHAADHGNCGEQEEISDVIIHHIMDSHDWHITDIPDGNGCYKPVALHLPWILYNSDKGLQFFGSTHALQEDPNYIVHHDHVYYVKSKEPVSISPEEAEKEPGKYLVLEEHGADGHSHAIVLEKMEGASIIDLSLTKTGLHILIVCILMLIVFRAVARGYKKNAGKAPKGIQSFFEPVILFVRNDVARPFLHEKADRFLPYLLTLFFFIWFANLLGLMPFNSNIAGNTSITVALAFLSFILILMNSNKNFWAHIFWFPGVPLGLKPLMLVVELMGLITKPVALAIRLFANISAGHFMVLSLVCLIFILGKGGESVAGGAGIAPLTILFSLFIFLLEMLVAVVQAFVFALLTAVFIGQAMESHDDH